LKLPTYKTFIYNGEKINITTTLIDINK